MTWIRLVPVVVMAAILGGAGCAISGPSATELLQQRRLLNRSALDLDCPTEPMGIMRLDEATRVVTGCGRQATYVEVCDAPWNEVTRRCTWLLNGAIRAVAP